MTRMFVAGRMPEVWEERLEDMIAVKDVVVDVLDRGELQPSMAEGFALAERLGHA